MFRYWNPLHIFVLAVALVVGCMTDPSPINNGAGPKPTVNTEQMLGVALDGLASNPDNIVRFSVLTRTTYYGNGMNQKGWMQCAQAIDAQGVSITVVGFWVGDDLRQVSLKPWLDFSSKCAFR